MDQESMLEKARKEFLVDCDLVVRVPLTWNLLGSSTCADVVIFPLKFYIYVGIKKNSKALKVTGKYFDSKTQDFVPLAELAGIGFTSMLYARLSAILPNTRNKNSLWIKTAEFKVLAPTPISIPYLNCKESIFTALCLLAYCSIHGIAKADLQDILNSFRSFIKTNCKEKGRINIAAEYKSKSEPTKKFIDLFKFCFPVPAANGGGTFLSLLGAPEQYCGLRYMISCGSNGEIDNPAQFEINELLERGSISVSLEDNREYPFDLLLAYSEEKKDKFWGPVLSPYLFDEVERLTLITETPQTCGKVEKWAKRFAYEKGYLEFFAPTSVIKNIMEELTNLQKSWILYSSKTSSFPWDSEGACILGAEEYKRFKVKADRSSKEEFVATPLKTEKLEYELVAAGKKPQFLPFSRAEELRQNRGLKTKKLFIDDERKEVFFNKKLIDEFQGQMYSMLRHFVTNGGIGGGKSKIYQEVWGDKTNSVSEDNLDGAVDTTITRFRNILRKNKIGEVVFRSEGVYSSTKIYMLKPNPDYCILSRVEEKS